MKKITKITDNDWLVQMSEDEYRNCYKIAGNAIEVDVISVQPTYYINHSFLKIKIQPMPELKIKPGMKLLISIKE